MNFETLSIYLSGIVVNDRKCKCGFNQRLCFDGYYRCICGKIYHPYNDTEIVSHQLK